ncbi:unnamed protein product [Rhizoctonia solani]|uniref:Uncharacterized protein n=1 Tax=Rhizoctonia solani TaxID=456999 RepID=A0A8H3G9V9_9AGAM|nr:unnamed protein product [Rhizoctonia solani]
MTFVGRIEGEGAERAWAYLNETSGSTSEKSPGARWDSINLIILDWNFEKEIRMAAFLVGKFVEAKRIKPRHVEYTRGKWTSPFEDTEYPVPGFQETIQRERAKEQGQAADKGSSKSGATKWIASAIELEYSISRHPEYSKLGLPTSYLTGTLKDHSLLELLELEIQLRRATCNDALRAVRHLLGAKALLLRYKRKNTSGERATTRAEKVMKDHQEKITKAQWRYNNSREALLRHSTADSDSKTYLEMKNSDLRRLDDYVEESKGLGQGYQSIAWIWRPANTPVEEAWEAETLKTEWFRARQRYRQWEEELKIIKREMVMTIRSYEDRAAVWDVKSKGDPLTEGMAEYAARKSYHYSRLEKDAAMACMDHINDPVVSLKWASE